MAVPPKSRSIVKVASDTHSIHALSEPTFIIQVGDVYYVTAAVWEYHPGEASTDQHHQGIGQVQQAFQKGQRVSCVMTTHTSQTAAPSMIMASGGHTSPPPHD